MSEISAGHSCDIPKELDTPGKRALYNNLGADGNRVIDDAPGTYADRPRPVDLALRVHEAVLRARFDDWRGVPPREQEIKAALHKELQDIEEVERI